MSKKKKQRVDKWVKKITPIVEKYQELDSFCDDAISEGFLTSDGKMYNLIWEMFDTLLNVLDYSDEIAWYIFDNRCGDADNRFYKRKITSIRQLAKFIVELEDE
jgi:hypothetical protein